MENFIKINRVFYGVGIAALGVQQFFYADFRPVIMPVPWIHNPSIWAYLTGFILLASGVLISLGKNIKTVSLLSGGLLLLLFIGFQVPYLLFIGPNSPTNLGLWTSPLKELAFSGGAFVIAGLYPDEKPVPENKNFLIRLLERLIPLGPTFFSITMIVFGIDHFIYTEFVATLVPSWIPMHVFWTYFAGVALIGGGVGIIFKIKLKLVATLVGAMIFLWFIFLHIPRGIADPYGDKGNEISSVFEALAFSGIAFMIAAGSKK